MKKTLLLLAIILITSYAFSQVATTLVTLNTNLKAKIEVGTTTTTLTLEGPSSAWFAIGFGGSTMAAGTDVFRTNGTAITDAKTNGQVLPVADASQDWTETSNTVSGTVRTIVATRANNTGDADDYTFSPTMTSLAVIWAYGSSATYGYHSGRGASMLTFTKTTVGLVENTFASDIKFYPNPTSDKVTIELGDNYSNIAVEVTNVLGQVVTRKNVATVSNRKMVLPINASSGVYFVRLTSKEGSASFRVLKK